MSKEAGRVDVSSLYLDPIPPGLRGDAVECLRGGDWLGFFILASNDHSVDLVHGNFLALESAGLLEEAFIHAVTATRTNNLGDQEAIRELMDELDWDRLRELAPPPPPHRQIWSDLVGAEVGAYRLFRGIAGEPGERFERGFYAGDRNEAEYWLDLPDDFPVTVRALAPKPLTGEVVRVVDLVGCDPEAEDPDA